MDPGTMREIARALILDHAEDVEALTISETLWDRLDSPSDPEEFEAACLEIGRLIREAKVYVEWPNEVSP